jgi:hypothetical protein
MTSRKWYWLAPALMVVGVAHLAHQITRLKSDVEGLQRAVMPGSASIALPSGDTTLYFERRSIVRGELFDVTGPMELRCSVTDPAGTAVSIEHPTSSVSYQVGRYAGANMFDLHVDVAGTYLLTCEAPSRFVMAVGSGIGTRIVVGVLGLLLAVALGGIAFVVVRTRRRSQRRSVELARAAVVR